MGHTGGMDTVLALRTALATTAQRRLAEVRMGAPRLADDSDEEADDSGAGWATGLARTA